MRLASETVVSQIASLSRLSKESLLDWFKCKSFEKSEKTLIVPAYERVKSQQTSGLLQFSTYRVRESQSVPASESENFFGIVFINAF